MPLGVIQFVVNNEYFKEIYDASTHVIQFFMCFYYLCACTFER